MTGGLFIFSCFYEGIIINICVLSELISVYILLMKRTLITLTIFVLLTAPFKSQAWSATGHRIIAEIAFTISSNTQRYSGYIVK
jgi:hypothetical protein